MILTRSQSYMYITNIFGDLARSQRFNFTSKSILMVNTISLCVLSDIAALTRELNNLSDRLNQLSEENEALREQLGLDPRQQVDLSPLRFRKKNEFEKLNQEYKLLSNEVNY